jgi:maltose alpha-D-glucosyltransferase/alpha-amylase
MNKEHLNNIFEAFYTTKKHGTGLGMALTKQIIEEHNGKIIVDSEPGKGTLVTLLFKGIEESNWEPNGDGWYYFHRFFSFQPDWNYKNPDVLLEMTGNLLYWQRMGIDGFRADAIPYLWKEEGTNCENLPKTHLIVKFFRAMLDYVKPGTLLLAEACQKPKEVVKYLGEGDECHAAYHFPLMPMMFKSIAAHDGTPVKHTLSPEVTPQIPSIAQWFTFLRVHDELSLELVYVSEEDRKFIHDHYCHKPEWDFRVGEGISARLSELMNRDPMKIALAYSLMLTLTGTPVVYYGDEFGKLNDDAFYQEQIKLTGKDDTRFLVRGRVDWETVEKELKDPNSFHHQVYEIISGMLNARQSVKVFGRGETEFLDSPKELLIYNRNTDREQALVVNNLTESKQVAQLPDNAADMEILFANGATLSGANIEMEPHGFIWLIKK